MQMSAAHQNRVETSLREQILHAREERQLALDTLLLNGKPTIFISLSIPGETKYIPGTTPLFHWAINTATQHINPAHPPLVGDDILGPYALYTTDHHAADAKSTAVAIEESTPSARLLDIDIYHGENQIDRTSLNLPQRRCLLCEAPAKECIRTGRHNHSDLVQAAHDLLATFRS